jgi:stage V sporulation protein SpoVS
MQAQASQQQHTGTTLEQRSTAGSSSSSSSSIRRGGQQLSQPQRPVLDPAAAAAAQEAQQQQVLPRQERLLAWRSHGKARAAAAAALQQELDQQEQHAHQQEPVGTSRSLQQQQQQQQLPAPPLEPSIVNGRAYLTSPVSIVAAGTVTRRLAGSVSAAFALHQHQLLFAVGPQALGVAAKALATARRMLGESEGGRAANILMQPTLRGGCTPMRSQSYALDIMRVGELPMQPGVAGRQAVTLLASNSTDSSSIRDSVYDGDVQQQQQQQQQVVPWADAKVVHITSSSNELAAARSLVENMPARGQTVMRAMGPYATETAVLALALARPLMRVRHGQDLAAVVLWNEQQQQQRRYRPGRETGLLLAVFRCEAGSFPPRVLLLPPSKRSIKRQEFWQQRGRRKPAALPLPQQQQQ